MSIKLENMEIAVRDLEAAIAFLTDLGLAVLGRDTVRGEWTDTAVGLDGNHAEIAMRRTPDGKRSPRALRVHPSQRDRDGARPAQGDRHASRGLLVEDINEALEIAERHGCHPLRGVATNEDMNRLTYVRGPSGILVMFAEEMRRG